MSETDCLFCKIVAGEIPATLVLETDRAIAFRDINPQASTHVLVVPRDHAPNAAATAAADPELAGHLLDVAGRVAAQEGVPDYRIVANTGAAAGQTVFHTHLHVLSPDIGGFSASG